MGTANRKPRNKYDPAKHKRGIHKNGQANPVAHVIPVVCSDYEKLTFDKFLKCLTKNDLSVLVEQGVPSAGDMFYAWITILSAYYTLIKSREQLKYIKMVAKMEGYNLKITVVTALCETLRIWYEPKLVACLKVWGYRLSYSEATLFADLDMTLTLLSNDNFKLMKMRAEYDNAHKDKKESGQVIDTKNAYMKILYAIEKFRQQRYPPATITVYEFGMWYNELTEYNEMTKASTQIKEPKRNKKSFYNGK
jgi:hypothetical protein